MACGWMVLQKLLSVWELHLRDSPDKLFIVQGLGRFPSQNVDVTLQDRELDFSVHQVLGMADATTDEFAFGAEPEAYHKERDRSEQ